MTSVEITILTRFKTGLVQFLDELVQWLPDDEELIATRILIQDQIPIEDVMLKFIRLIKPYSQKIANREDEFFLTDPKIFGQVEDQSRVLSLKRLWKHPEFTKDDREKAWKWMDFFIKCINLYEQHRTS